MQREKAAVSNEVEQWADDDELNLREAALYLERTPKTLYNLINAENGPRRIKDGKYWKFIFRDLKRYKNQRREVVEAYTK
jgi:hypothetical protein